MTPRKGGVLAYSNASYCNCRYSLLYGLELVNQEVGQSITRRIQGMAEMIMSMRRWALSYAVCGAAVTLNGS